MKSYPIVLSLAGSDCTGEAGIQSDLKTISGLNAYAATVITSIAVFNSVGIKTIHAIPAKIVKDQIEYVMENMWPDVVKIGLVNDVETARTIADCLRKYHPKYVVFDPVMQVNGVMNIPDNETLKVIKDELLHHTNLMTINLPEAEVYAERKIETRNDVKETAQMLAEKHRIPVLVKAGNLLVSNTYDVLHIPDGEKWEYVGNKMNYPNIHAASLIFSAGIATFLAFGEKLHVAVRKAREYVEFVIENKDDTPIVLERDLIGILVPVVKMEEYQDMQKI